MLEKIIMDLDGTIVGIRQDVFDNCILYSLKKIGEYDRETFEKLKKLMLFQGVRSILGDKYIDFWRAFNKIFGNYNEKKYFIFEDALKFLKNFNGNVVIVSDAPKHEIEVKLRVLPNYILEKILSVISTNPSTPNEINGERITFNYKPDAKSLEWIVENVLGSRNVVVIGDSIFDVFYGAGNGHITILVNRYFDDVNKIIRRIGHYSVKFRKNVIFRGYNTVNSKRNSYYIVDSLDVLIKFL